MAYEVFTTRDKSKRDEIFRELRASTEPNERKAVKFSGVEPVTNDKGQVYRQVRYFGTGRVQLRPVFISTWSVAYPNS